MESVVALFPSRQQAQTTLETLKERGFAPDRLGFAIADSVAESDMAQETGISPEANASSGSAGIIKGAILGLIGGLVLTLPIWLLLLIVPSTRVYAEGGVTGMLFGAIGGLALGGLFGALGGDNEGNYVNLLRRMGVPTAQAQRFTGGLQKGYVMVVARDPSGQRTDEALSVMRRNGAVKLDELVGASQSHGGH